MQNSFTLSKSAFIRDVQCHKSESQFSYDNMNINNGLDTLAMVEILKVLSLID